jgi:hypothetical protein
MSAPPWYSGKLTDPISLSPGKTVPVAEITVDREGYALVAGNLKMKLRSTKPVKLDIWLLRVKADDPTCYSSPTFPGGEDDFYWWPVWMGAIDKGETYRWYVRTETGLSGTLTTRYCKGHPLRL